MAPPVYRDALADGFAKRDPALGPLQISAGGMLAIAEGEERERHLQRARQMLALYTGGMGARNKNFYNDILVQYGFPDAAHEIQDLYLSGKKDAAAALVPQDVVEKLNLIGSESFVRERIAAYAESGVTVLNVVLLQDDLELVGKVKSWLPN
jgi:alkanesulfonate monooxygenase SsuD/methylene tetrahydromethanopterin reductase-like flavin-dependent oxidoreductase (luciferase family)